MNGIENLDIDKHAKAIIENYSINELIQRYTNLLVRNEELTKENQELKRKLDKQYYQESKQRDLEETSKIPDYEEVQDNNGRIWYKRTHLNAQKKESRQLEKYDIIISKRNLDEPVPNILFIDSFDYDSDFTARCFYGKSVDYDKKGNKESYSVMWYHNFCPAENYFSFANYDEIKELFDKVRETDYIYKEFISNKEIMERYSEYLD